MENASKALLIAGAILLVIAIIAIAVGIVSSTRGTIDVAENQIHTMEVQMHNKQWLMYEGKVTGAEVKECIAKVLANNSKTKNMEMKVLVFVGNGNCYGQWHEGTNAGYGNGSLQDSSIIPSNDIYNGKTIINSLGIINQIRFEK